MEIFEKIDEIRTPHRPNAIGLSVAKIEGLDSKGTLILSGLGEFFSVSIFLFFHLYTFSKFGYKNLC